MNDRRATKRVAAAGPGAYHPRNPSSHVRRRVMRSPRLLALVAAGFLSAASAAQGPVTLKLKKDEVGDRTKQVIDEETTTATAIDANGQKQNKVEKKTVKYVFVEEVLAKPAGAKKPTKLSRAYETAEATTDGAKKTLPFQGKTVLIEKKGTRFEFTVDGKPLSEDDAKLFAQEFGKGDGPDDEDLLPPKPVSAGDTWTPNMEKLLPLMAKEMPFDLAKTGNAAAGKFFKAYPKDGKTFGEFELTFALKPTAVKDGENVINLKPGSTLGLVMKLDACVDGTAHTGTMTNGMTASLDCDLPMVSLKLQIDGKQTHTITPVK
jgi:hypothetical protein